MEGDVESDVSNETQMINESGGHTKIFLFTISARFRTSLQIHGRFTHLANLEKRIFYRLKMKNGLELR